MDLLALALPGLLGFSGPPAPDQTPRVFGGMEVPPGTLESVVAVSTPTSFCTGTLISPDVVLTAAHCLDDDPDPSLVNVLRGVNVGTSPDAILSVAETGAHPCYSTSCDPGDGFDVGYVKLSDPVDAPESFGFPTVITDQAMYDALVGVGKAVTVVGYGEDLFGGQGVKRRVDIDITGFSRTGREFDAGGGGADSCNGDSGGPALVGLPDGSFRIAGIVSRGYTCGQGGVYTNPMPTLCWIQGKVGESLLPPGCPYCACVNVDPKRNDGGCGCGRAREPAWVLLVLALGLLRRRRRGTVA